MRIALGTALGLLLFAAAAVAALVASVPELSVPAQLDLRIVDATVIEPGFRRRHRQTVTIREGRIRSVGRSAPGDQGGPWDGLFVMPGLVDLHVHLPPPFLPGELRAALALFLANGVTTVRDAGSPWGWSLGTRGQVERGGLAGPRIFSCGRFLVGEESWPGAIVIREVEEVGPAIARLRAEAVDCVKVLDTVRPSVAAAIRDEAHAAGLQVIGHVPRTSDGRLLLDEVQHLTGLDAALRTLHPAALSQAVADSLAEHAAHTPTLVVLERFARGFEGRSGCDGECRFLPRYYQTLLWDPHRIPALGAMVSDLGFAPRERFEAAKKMVNALARGGVTILAGTDTPTFYNVPGESLHEEIRLLHDAGLSAEEALAAATTRAADALGDDRLGRIEPGSRADLLLLRSDPIEAVQNTRPLDVVASVVNGRLYTRESLEAQLLEYEHLFRDSAYATAIDWAARKLVR